MTCNNSLTPSDFIFQTTQNNLVFENSENIMIFQVTGLVNIGTGGSTSDRVYNEKLTNQITGSNNIFTVAFPLVSGSEEVKLNGVNQSLIDDYIVLNSTSIQLILTPDNQDKLLISYNKS